MVLTNQLLNLKSCRRKIEIYYHYFFFSRHKGTYLLNFSARAHHRILKVARTITDLADSKDVLSGHIAEAVQYRRMDTL